VTASKSPPIPPVVRKGLRDWVWRPSEIVEPLASLIGASPWDLLREVWIPKTHERADIVVASDALHGFEIKGPRDDLRRLARQTAAYERVFQTCTVVLDTRHVQAGLGVIGAHWGVIVVDRGQLHQERFAEVTGVDPELQVQMLWRGEVLSALAKVGKVPAPDQPRALLWRTLLEAATPRQVHTIVAEALGARRAIDHRFGRKVRRQAA